MKAGLGIESNPLEEALRGFVLGSEAFLKQAVAMAAFPADPQRQRTIRRMIAISSDEIIVETADYFGVEPAEYIGFRSRATGREIAALLCRRWTGDSLTLLSARFGLSHPDSASNLVRKAKSRIEKSRDYRRAVEEIEYNPGLKTENQA